MNTTTNNSTPGDVFAAEQFETIEQTADSGGDANDNPELPRTVIVCPNGYLWENEEEFLTNYDDYYDLHEAALWTDDNPTEFGLEVITRWNEDSLEWEITDIDTSHFDQDAWLLSLTTTTEHVGPIGN